jgi:SAM-dependent methyltransferase
MYCLLCPEARRRKTPQEWSGVCGVCKHLSPAELDFLYWIQEESPERAVIAPIKLRFSQYASRRRYEAAWQSIPLGVRVLEIGCAGGLGAEFASSSRLYVALDIARSQIRYARRRLPELNLLEATGAEIPFGAACFETVICLDVVEHMITDVMLQVCREIIRVLAPGGKLILSTPDGTLTPAKPLLGRKVHDTHVLEYPPSEMVQHLRDVGFEDVGWSRLDFPHFPASFFGKLAQNTLPEMPWLLGSATPVTQWLGYANCLYIARKSNSSA